MRANVYVTLKSGVLDPQGKAIQRSLGTLGLTAEGVRIGRFIQVDVAETDPEAARAQVTEMCEKLLANPVIEDYRIELEG